MSRLPSFAPLNTPSYCCLRFVHFLFAFDIISQSDLTTDVKSTLGLTLGLIEELNNCLFALWSLPLDVVWFGCYCEESVGNWLGGLTSDLSSGSFESAEDIGTRDWIWPTPALDGFVADLVTFVLSTGMRLTLVNLILPIGLDL